MSLFATNRKTGKRFPRYKQKRTKKKMTKKSGAPLKEESPMENEGVF
jgi:hypothetical protein